MKKKIFRKSKKQNIDQICRIFLALILSASLAMAPAVSVYADTLEEIQQQKEEAQKEKNQTQGQLNSVNKEISSITGAQDTLGEEMEEIDAEMVAILTDIGLIQADIENKEEEILQTQAEYDAAVEEENAQYEAMKIRAKYLYEKGEMSMLMLLLQSENMSDALTKADYIEKLYEYDRKMLLEYQAAVQRTAELKAQLEEEKSELETSKIELEEEQSYLEELLAQKQEEYDNYEVQLTQAKQKAAAYTAQINQQTKEIRALEKKEAQKKKEIEEEKRKAEEAKKKAEQEAAAASGTSSGSSSKNSQTSYSVSGSGTGAQIASYGLQFVGNPYVAGGTSLTDGADCSGFVQAVYKHFGYNLPRTSYAQAGIGRAVSYSEAQAGDIIYYGGHVGIYIGNGQIVHASTQRTGIKVSSALYRSIVTIRRVI